MLLRKNWSLRFVSRCRNRAKPYRRSSEIGLDSSWSTLKISQDGTIQRNWKRSKEEGGRSTPKWKSGLPISSSATLRWRENTSSGRLGRSWRTWKFQIGKNSTLVKVGMSGLEKDWIRKKWPKGCDLKTC